jgi:hypothetical protein
LAEIEAELRPHFKGNDNNRNFADSLMQALKRRLGPEKITAVYEMVEDTLRQLAKEFKEKEAIECPQ